MKKIRNEVAVMKTKARAVMPDTRQDLELSATDLAKNDEELNEIVGYRLDERNDVTLLTLKDFTGAKNERIFAEGITVEQMRGIGTATNKINKRDRVFKRVFLSFLITPPALMVASGIELMVALLFLDKYSYEVKVSLAVLILMATQAIFSLSVCALVSCVTPGLKLPRWTSRRARKAIKGVRVVQAKQGFKSLDDGKPFAMRSPNRESLLEAITLLNEAYEIKGKIESLKRTMSSNYSTLDEGLSRMQSSLVAVNDHTSKLREIENQIAEILLREER